jgi:hypothetical protein
MVRSPVWLKRAFERRMTRFSNNPARILRVHRIADLVPMLAIRPAHAPARAGLSRLSTLKKEAIRPAGANLLQQQAKFNY